MPKAFYRVHALLHTMRLIQEHEDQLCTLMTEIRNAGEVSPELQTELHALLEEIPAADLQSNVDAVRETLGLVASPPKKAARRSNQPPAKSARKAPGKAQLKAKAGAKPKAAPKAKSKTIKTPMKKKKRAS